MVFLESSPNSAQTDYDKTYLKISGETISFNKSYISINGKHILIKLGTKNTDFYVNSYSSKHTIIAYNYKGNILTLSVDIVLHNNIKKNKTKINNALLIIFLTDEGKQKNDNNTFKNYKNFNNIGILKELILYPFTDKKYININNKNK